MGRGRKRKRKALKVAVDNGGPAELNTAAEGISDEDHDRLMAALAELEVESKEMGRREMEKLEAMFRSPEWQ